MRTFAEIINSVVEKPDIFVTGTVTAVDEGTLSCEVAPDDGGEHIRNAALRVMRYQNDAGFTIVPKVGTEVIVGWLAPNRPTVIQVQEWAKVLCLTTAGFGLAVEETKVRLGKRINASHYVPWGDKVEERIANLENTFDNHVHTGGTGGTDPTGKPTSTASTQPKFASTEVFTS
jgi:hypothetical protein